MATKRYQDLSDDQVLEMVGTAGPAIVGSYLFERSEWVKKNNPLGIFGPTITGEFPGGAFIPSEKAKAELRAEGMLDELPEPTDAPADAPVLEAAAEAPAAPAPVPPKVPKAVAARAAKVK